MAKEQDLAPAVAIRPPAQDGRPNDQAVDQGVTAPFGDQKHKEGQDDTKPEGTTKFTDKIGRSDSAVGLLTMIGLVTTTLKTG